MLARYFKGKIDQALRIVHRSGHRRADDPVCVMACAGCGAPTDVLSTCAYNPETGVVLCLRCALGLRLNPRNENARTFNDLLLEDAARDELGA